MKSFKFKSDVYFFKTFDIGKWSNLREIKFVLREKEFYQKKSIGIWWKKSLGVGVLSEINKSPKQLKYLMVGFSFISVVGWVEFKWVGESETNLHNKLFIKDK